MPTDVKPRPLEIINFKNKLLEQYEHILSEKEKIKALEDPHAFRSPRWCGITVHVAINCPYNCIYCYIEDMGFKHSKPIPYPLSGKELIYALLKNPAFLPGKTGTLIAIGSVSEPFSLPNKALEFIEELSKLGNPIQFSTKSYITPSLANKLATIDNENPSSINPLITVITIEKSNILEPLAPSPEKRFDSIKNLRDAGLKPVLFLRPIIPGVNDNEILDVLKKAKEAGAYGVVFGSFRITERILRKLENVGLNTALIKQRVKKIDYRQRAINLPEKEKFIQLAKNIGLIPWKSACCANSWNAQVPCASACFIDGPTTRCPNLCAFPKNSADKNELAKALDLLGIKARIKGPYVKILNYPHAGVEFLVRTLGRYATILPKHVKRERIKVLKSTTKIFTRLNNHDKGQQA